MRYKIIFLLLIFTASLFSAETNKMQILGNGQKVDNEFVDKKKLDSNMQLCAGLQIETDLVGLSFESDNGIVSKDEKPGFYILYLSADERKVTVLCSGFEPLHIILRNYSIGLEKGGFYKIKVTGDKKVGGEITVNIQTTPSGATIFIDGKDCGTAEQQKVSVGSHDLKLVKSGFEIINKKITVSADLTLFKNTLKEIEDVPLSITSTPSGARVEIDGVKLGVTPISSFYASGTYQIKLSKDGCEDFSENVTVTAPKTAKSYKLQEIVCYLTINTNPKAEVYLNGSKITDLKKIKLEPQAAEVKIKMRKAADIVKRIVLKKDDNITLDLFPEIAVGKIQVAVMPDDASVELKDDGGDVYTSVGSKAFNGLVVGEYKLTVKANGYKTVSETVNLRDGDKLTKSVTLEKGADVGRNFVFVPGGTFQMGSNDGEDNEKPVHSVTVSDFYIGKYEVTQNEWKTVMGSNPSYFTGDDLPVEQVSWNDCQEFIRKLNAKTGKKYRLPTEAEWEYACRGGESSVQYEYSGSDNIAEVAWYKDNSGRNTHPVGQKQANELGIYDMSGNVWEWCSDLYGDKYYDSSPSSNPHCVSSSSYRVDRGGSWDSDGTTNCRVAYRGYYIPTGSGNYVGFRLALTP